MASPGMWQSDRRYYTDRPPSDPRARIVPEGSPSAAFVLVAAGGEILLTEAKRFGLVTIREERVTEVKEPVAEREDELGTAEVVAPDHPTREVTTPVTEAEPPKAETSEPSPKRASGKG